MKPVIINSTNKNTQRARWMLLTVLLIVGACHPPVENYLNRSYQHTQSWLGAPAAELILVKGTPKKITYLGWQQRAQVESTYWTPELDRFMYYFREYGTQLPLKSALHNKEQYQAINTDGPWLITYSQPVRSYRSDTRECVEFFVIDNRGLVIESGYQGTYVSDHRHCPAPLARPNQNQGNLGWFAEKSAQ